MSSRAQRVEVRIKIALKYPDRDTFAQRFAHNISRTGIFIRARDPAPVGSRVHFEYVLADSSRVLRGSGIVRWTRKAGEGQESDRPAGMGVEFVDLDSDSEQLVGTIVAKHGEGERAPRRKTPARDDKRSSAQPREAASVPGPTPPSLEPDEETAIDALVSGLPPPVPVAMPAPPPAAEVPASSDAKAKAEEEPPPAPAAEPASPAPAEASAAPPEAQPEAVADEVVAGEPLLVIDLSGADIPVAARALGAANEGKLQRQAVPTRVESKAGVLAARSTGGLRLAHLMSWLDWARSPAHSRALARRLGVELASEKRTGLAVASPDGPIALDAALKILLDAALGPYPSDVLGAATTIVIVPPLIPRTIVDRVHKHLKSKGASTVRSLPSAFAALTAAQVALDVGSTALAVEVGAYQARVTLVETPERVLGTRSGMALGYWDVDRQVADALALVLLREHDLDATRDGAPRQALIDEAIALRHRLPVGPLTLSTAGVTLSLGEDTLSRAASAAHERLVLMADALLAENAVMPQELGALVIAADEPSWPGLVESFESLLGAKPVVAPAGPFVRVEALARKLS